MTDWYGAGAMLLAGIIIGVLVLYRMKRRSDVLDPETHELEGRRNELVRQLRELHDAGGSEEERKRLERETANVLRTIDTRDSRRAQATTAKQAAPETLARRASMQGFAWGVASVALLGGLGWYVSQKAQPKADPSQSSMAGQSGTIQQAAPKSDPALQEMEAAVAKDPNNLPRRDELARAYLDRENLMAVFDQTQFVLQRTPDDPRALTYQALVRIAMGQVDNSETMFARAIKADPKFLDAYVGLAWAQITAGKAALAEQTVQAAIKQHPEEQARLTDALAKMKQQAAAQPPSPKKHPPVDGPDRSAPAMAQMPAGSNTPMETPTHVTVQLAAGRTLPSTGIIFIIARSAGVTSGPPVAVKRLPLTAFPLQIDLSSADSMTGEPLPPVMRLEARVDSDGNPMTHDPKDPVAMLDQVPQGSKVQLTLH